MSDFKDWFDVIGSVIALIVAAIKILEGEYTEAIIWISYVGVCYNTNQVKQMRNDLRREEE